MLNPNSLKAKPADNYDDLKKQYKDLSYKISTFRKKIASQKSSNGF